MAKPTEQSKVTPAVFIFGSPSGYTGNRRYKNNLVNSSFSELYHANSTISLDDNAAYDNLNRLITFRRGILSSSGNNGAGLDTVTSLNGNSLSSQVWTLDAVGNQTSVNNDNAPTAQTNTVNSQNEETGFGASTLAFDNDGNTTTDDQGHTLVYDAWNRLVAVKSGGTTLVSYGYDAVGNRITRTAGGATTDFYNSSAGQVLEERQAGAVTNQYVWSLAYVNTPVLRDDSTSGGSYGRSGSGMGQRVYVQEDANFNVTALTDASGNVLERFVYSPYGVQTVIGNTTAWSTASDTLSWVYTFQGGRYDATSGMIHFRAREYSPSLARWVQADPDGYVNGPDLYQTSLDNPIRFVDPMGTIVVDPITGNPIVTLPKPDPRNPREPRTSHDITTNTGYQIPAGTPYVQTTNGPYVNVTITTDDGTTVHAQLNITPNPGRNRRPTNRDFDCHGHSFGNDALWINDDQVKSILKGDGYEQVSDPQPGDIAVYYSDGTPNGDVQHSAVVDRLVTNRNGVVTQVLVRGKGGIEAPQPYIKDANVAWPPRGPKIKPVYYRKKAPPTTKPTTNPSGTNEPCPCSDE